MTTMKDRIKNTSTMHCSVWRSFVIYNQKTLEQLALIVNTNIFQNNFNIYSKNTRL